MNKLQLFILCLIFPMILFAQEDLPVTPDVEVEVLTTELDRSTKPQTVQALITVRSADLTSLNLNFADLHSSVTPVAVTRGNENLWLINSDEANANNKVLAWQYITSEKTTQLLPGKWNTPYTLILELQVSFERMRELKKLSELTFILLAEINGTTFIASPIGRGQNITLKYGVL